MPSEIWEQKSLSELSRIRRGASPRPISSPMWFADHGPGWIRISDVTKSDGVICRTKQYLSPAGVKRSVSVYPGQVIMSICATLGEPILIGREACIHDGFVVFDQHEKTLDTSFLIHHLRAMQPYFRGQGQTGTQANLNTAATSSTSSGNVHKLHSVDASTRYLGAGGRQLYLPPAYRLIGD